MPISRFLPPFVKNLFRPIYRSFVGTPNKQSQSYNLKSREELHEYWSSPPDGNFANNYAGEKESQRVRSELLVRLTEKYCSKDGKILEIGCNVGRNLHYLHQAGFRNLCGIEISQQAVDLMVQRFPEMAESARILVGPVEEKIKELSDGEFDLVFTMAVLEHIHTESEWIFAEMARVAKDYLITLEDEAQLSWRHFPRNYKKIFEPLGFQELESFECVMETHGMNPNFRGRIFKKE